MDNPGNVVIVGGTSEFGKRIAQHYASQGYPTVLTSRDTGRAEDAAKDVGDGCVGVALDLTKPREIADALAGVDDVQHLVLVPVQRDENRVREFNIDGAMYLVTLKLIGYIEVIHVLSSRLREDSSILLFGGQARARPYPGSTTVTMVNGGVTTVIRSLAIELAPTRVNAIHPSVVGESPYWAAKPQEVLEMHRSRTVTGRMVTTDEVVDASVFLLENRGVTGVNLVIDAGTRLT